MHGDRQQRFVGGGIDYTSGTIAVNQCTIVSNSSSGNGDGTGFTTDQRGWARISGAFADIGAAELSPSDLQRVVTTAANSGPGSLRDAISNAISDTTITFTNTLFDSINLTSGQLLLNKNLAIDASSIGGWG